MDAVAMKKCASCKADLPIDRFLVDRRRPSGLGSHCRPCGAEMHKRCRAKPVNKAKLRARLKEWRKDNRESFNTWTRQYVAKNKERVRERQYAWATANPEKVRASRAKYKKVHPEVGRDLDRARRARRRNAVCIPYREQDIYERDGWLCGICHETVDKNAPPRSKGSPSIDHKIPLSRGGSDTPENVQLAHFTCNCKKGPRVLQLL